MTNSNGQAAEDRAAEAALLEFTARLFTAELDTQALENLKESGLTDLLDRLEPGTAAWIDRAAHDQGLVDELAAEFCRLFLMSKQTSPVASAWARDGAAQKDGERLAAAVEAWEAALGVELRVDEVWGNLPKDHLARLLGLRALALTHGSDSGLQLADAIYTESLQSWTPSFCAAVREHGVLPVYIAAAELLRSTLSPGD